MAYWLYDFSEQENHLEPGGGMGGGCAVANRDKAKLICEKKSGLRILVESFKTPALQLL